MQLPIDLSADNIFKWFGYVSAAYLALAGARKEIKLRSFAPRLELTVNCALLKEGSTNYLSADVGVKNIGTALAVIEPAVSYIQISRISPPRTPAAGQPDNNVPHYEIFETFRVFATATQIESGESVGDFLLANLPDTECLAFLVEFGVTTHGTLGILPSRDWTKPVVINCKLQPNT